MNLRTFFWAIAFLATGSPVLGQLQFEVSETTALSAEDQEKAESVVEAYLQAIVDEDIDALAATMADDFRLILPWEDAPLSKEQELEEWKENFDTWEDLTLDVRVTSFAIQPAGEEQVYPIVMIAGEATWNDAKLGVEGFSLIMHANIMVVDGHIQAMWNVFDRLGVRQTYEAAMEEVAQETEE